ncbi:Fis family transcriptional regulator [Geobacter sulfurreducens]|nr:Fis family transcriptional regulator [Geobacter sulfurreducens]
MGELTDVTILYVEDEPVLREQVVFALRMHFSRVLSACDGKEAMRMIRAECPDVVVSDIRMPAMDGLTLASLLKTELPDLPVVLCTALHETDHLLKAIELGVAAYVSKPIDLEKLQHAIRLASLPCVNRREIARLRSEAAISNGLLGEDSVMRPIAEQLQRVADTDLSVMLLGEPGTGKNFLAAKVHALSKRKTRPFLAVDCLARTPEQLEKELFGEAKGRGRPSSGATELLSEADGGTLLLDGPERLPLQLQQRLFNLLEDGMFVPNGSIRPAACNLRVITVTGANLDKLAQAGTFSQELLERLKDVEVTLPPLRERRSDIPLLARFFLAVAADEFGRHCPSMTTEAEELLQQQQWPGNLRQLKQLMRRALFMAGNPISGAGLKPLIGQAASPIVPDLLPSSLDLTELEKWAIIQALAATDGKKQQAARLLGVSYNTFKDKIRRYNLTGL